MRHAMVKRVARVDALTPEQRARMPEWRDKWIEIGLRTGPADRPAFERHVAECYRVAGLKPPKRVVWVPSPFVLAFAAPTASIAIELRRAVQKGPLSAATFVRGGGAVDVAVRDAVDVAVRGAVGDAVGGAVRGADIIRKAVVETIRRVWTNHIGGQFWVGGWYWGTPSFVSFFTDVCGLELSTEMQARAKSYAGTVESACWWWPHRDFVMVSERPEWIDRDDQGRLHSESRAAIAWPDGWGVHRIHGVTVPGYVVERPETISVANIDAERNSEVRRIMVERMGVDRFMRESGAKLVHKDQYGELYRREMPDGARPLLAVRVWNKTIEADGGVREFWLRVHPELRPLPNPADPERRFGEPQAMTAHAAVASTFGKMAEEYAPVIET
jgi:hypothetical protein